jgi:hypothetical protein
VRIRYQNVFLYAHRIVWAARHGFLCPYRTINHRDLDGTNNEPRNLELIEPGKNLSHAKQLYGRMGMTAAEAKKNWINSAGGGRRVNWRGRNGQA